MIDNIDLLKLHNTAFDKLIKISNRIIHSTFPGPYPVTDITEYGNIIVRKMLGTRSYAVYNSIHGLETAIYADETANDLTTKILIVACDDSVIPLMSPNVICLLNALCDYKGRLPSACITEWLDAFSTPSLYVSFFGKKTVVDCKVYSKKYCWLYNRKWNRITRKLLQCRCALGHNPLRTRNLYWLNTEVK